MRKGIKVFYLLNAIAGIFFALLSMSSNAAGDTLQAHEYAVTSTASWETRPRLGNDGVSDLVVFTRRDMLPNGTLGKGDIWFQRLAGGAPDGAPVQVTSGPQDNELNDVSGDYIVYTAYDSTTSLSGRIMLYQISTLFFTPSATRSSSRSHASAATRWCGAKVPLRRPWSCSMT